MLIVVSFPVTVVAGTYDDAYFGAKWLSSFKEVKSVVRGKITVAKRKLSPLDVPHVRSLGHLYFMEAKDFSKLTAVSPVRGGGNISSEYYFYKDELAIVKIFYNYEDASFQGLLSSLETDYGKAEKDASKGVDGIFVQHRFDLKNLIIKVSYHPYKVDNGYACKELVCRMVNKTYIKKIDAHHDKLREKYGE